MQLIVSDHDKKMQFTQFDTICYRLFLVWELFSISWLFQFLGCSTRCQGTDGTFRGWLDS